MARTVTSHLSAKSVRSSEELRPKPSDTPTRARKVARVAVKRKEEEVTPAKAKEAPRGKYLAAVVAALASLGERRGSSRAALLARMQEDNPRLPWGNKPVIKRFVGLALKAGLEEGVLCQQGLRTGKGSGCYRLGPQEVRRQTTLAKARARGSKRLDAEGSTEEKGNHEGVDNDNESITPEHSENQNFEEDHHGVKKEIKEEALGDEKAGSVA